MNRWQKQANLEYRGMMTAWGVGYKELSQLFERVGEDVSANALSRRVERGAYPYTFILQTRKALELFDQERKWTSREEKDTHNRVVAVLLCLRKRVRDEVPNVEARNRVLKWIDIEIDAA